MDKSSRYCFDRYPRDAAIVDKNFGDAKIRTGPQNCALGVDRLRTDSGSEIADIEASAPSPRPCPLPASARGESRRQRYVSRR